MLLIGVLIDEEEELGSIWYVVCVYFYAYIHNNEIVMNFSCLNTAPLLVSILFSRLLILNIANLTHIPPCHTSVCLETRKKNGCRDTQVNREQ
jgi:hypothetical protein